MMSAWIFGHSVFFGPKPSAMHLGTAAPPNQYIRGGEKGCRVVFYLSAESASPIPIGLDQP